ncbi:MAG: amino acid dehydrogenase [Proteobacteria bacterium]|nr:amino acid dehydrogenase [Pseudomonadota bacterium]
MFSHPDFDDHETVIFSRDEACGLRAIVAVHSTALGPGFGGCRMFPYEDEDAALTDVLRLSRGMTYKAAICELPLGGGKSVIIGDPKRDKTPALLAAMGRLVAGLNGAYIIADDVGTSLDDLAVMRRETAYTAAATAAARQPLAVTAYGVLQALESATAAVLGRTGLAGLAVAVQGLGNVGMPLCGYLAARGAKLTVSDIDPGRVAAARRDFGAKAVAVDAIYDEAVEVFAPCAFGAILNDDSIPRLRARIVCGGANNQLRSPAHDARLAARGIVYVPDYLANAGGVIDYHQERIDDRPAAVLGAVDRIGAITADVLARAAASGKTPLTLTDAAVRQRLAAARPAPPPN